MGMTGSLPFSLFFQPVFIIAKPSLFENNSALFLYCQQGVEKQASGRQPRRAAFWKTQHIQRYVSITKAAHRRITARGAVFQNPAKAGYRTL
jgi:hypothetical protein